MRPITISSMVFICVMALGIGACSDDTAQVDDGGAADAATVDQGGTPGADAALDDGGAAPALSFKNLTAYDGFQGQAALKVAAPAGATQVELLVDGKAVASSGSAPFTIDWDTTKVGDGVVKLCLRATVAGQTQTCPDVPAVVYNNGTMASWKNGHSGTIIVPKTGYVDQHLKYHWDMPDGVKQVIGVLSWDKPGYELELALGTGTCPHSGTTAVKQTAKVSPAVATFGDGKQALTKVQWFAHVDLKNRSESKLLGTQTPFSVKAFLLK